VQRRILADFEARNDGGIYFRENTYGRNTRSFARAINIKNEKDAQVEANRTRKNVEYTAYRVTVWPSCDVVKMRIPKLTKPIR
jgi:hypothetical protein